MTKSFLLACCLSLSASPAFAQDIDPANLFGANAAHVEADVRFLADDLLEGREAGTRGYDIAAAYVASRFAGLGLQPAGPDGGWFQNVTLRKATLDADKSAVTLVRGGQEIALDATMAMPRPSLAAETVALDAPMVFVGRGIDAPELGLDDYAGLDVAGKVVVYLDDVPESLGPDYRSHISQSRTDMAAKHGAIGTVSIGLNDDARAQRMYDFFAKRPAQSWADAEGRNGALPDGMTMAIRTSAKGAAAIMDGASVPLAELAAMAKDGKALPRFDLPGTIKATATSTFEDFSAPNVMAKIEGADPARAGEYVVLLAHLDHVGIKKNAKPGEDNIHNGALDNAAGIATMLEAARMFSEATGDARPDRTIIFAAVTAEEKGLLGSEYLVAHPTVPMDKVVGNLSLDMPVPLYDFADVVAFGAEHSSMADYIAAAGKTMGITLSPDPMPEEGIFTRSDHYSFAKAGIPSVLLFTGYGNGGEEVWADFFAHRYHQVGDDLSQDFHWNALARYAALNYRIANAIAEDDARPLWYEGNFFGNAFAPGAPRAKKQ